MASTHTYVELEVSDTAYDGEIDMAGIALARAKTPDNSKVVATFCPRCNFPGPDWRGDNF